MAESIDQLQIDINAQANRANKVIDTLCSKIDRLTVSMNHLDGSKLGVLANGVQRLGTAMKSMNNVKTADFTRLAKNLQTLNNLDVSKLSNLSVNVKHIATSFNGLSGMEESAKQMTALASGIKQLGYSSAEKAITNIPLLATAMKKLMSELSTAPKVSQNLIDMTNALAKLARTGSSSGKAANSLVSSFNRISKASSGMKINLLSAVNGISAIRKSILQAMGIAGGFYAVFQGIKESINISSDLTEVQNVVDVTFGNFKKKIEDLADVSIPELGMSELTVKQIASRFQAMGVAMGISQKGMADMSTESTRLAGDMASFYNVEQKAVGEDLESIFTGQTKPLRQYGLDLTEATLQEWAMKQGMDANINSMSQMEKTMLRYQYVMANTGAAQGDFLRTQDTWANQVRILKENFRELASVIGSSFIHALKPLVKALNSAMSAIISFAKVVSNALGKIFGWKYEDTTGGIASNFSDAADSADGLASGTGRAADNAKKLKQQLQGIDELNVLSSNNDTGTGGGSGGGGGASGGEDASGGQWVQTDGILQSYESQLDTLFKLGEHIGQTLTDAMNRIDWNSVYEGARNFGSGLASFLNGLISPELFGATGRTVAGALNTAIYSALSFGETFDFEDLGNSIASGINEFFRTFDFKSLAKTINTWVKGIATTISTALSNIDYKDVFSGFLSFFETLDISTITVAIGTILWTHGGKEIVAGALSRLLSTQIALGIGSATIPLSSAIGISFAVAIGGFWIGNKLYEKLSGEEAMGGIADLIDMDASLQEIGQAISDGAVTEISITPIIRAIAGDSSITTDEVTSAMADMFDDLDYWLYDRLKEAWDFAWEKFKEYLKVIKTGIEIAVYVVKKAIDKKIEKLLEYADKGKEIKQILKLMFKQKKDKFVSWVLETVQKTKEFGADLKLGFEKAKENFVSKILEKIADKKGFSADIKANFIDEKNPASKLTSWVLDQMRKKNPFSGNIKSIFSNGNPNSLISWVFEKIKTTKDDLTKNITSMFKNADENNLISWVMGKIKGSNEDLTKNITSKITDGGSDSVVKYVFGKIKEGSQALKKDITSKLSKSSETDSLLYWVMSKIKGDGNGSLKKNIYSAFAKSAKTNPLLYWVFEKIKGGIALAKNISASISKGNSNVLVTWFLDKIRSGVLLAKSVIAKLDIGGIGYNAFKSFVDMYNSLKSKAIDFALNFNAITQDLKSWINGNIIAKINTVFSKVPILRNHQIPYLANGGMLDGKGQLFVAREKGPELVTSYGNKSAVMNNNQIVESVSGGVEIAVRNANAEQIALQRQQNELLYEILQKETGISYKEVFDATRKGNSEYKAMHGHSALA